MRCNNCGWENPDGNTKCDKCNAPLQGGDTKYGDDAKFVSSVKSTIREDKPFEKEITAKTIPDTKEEHTDPVPHKNSSTNPPIGGGTINPWGPGVFTSVPRCVLKPVIFPGEDKRYAPQQLNVKGDCTELNRENLDPDNNAITSKVQAVLTFKDGKWYIQDRSIQKTTFIYAGEPMEVKPGDVILMGNRSFVFDVD